MEELDKLLEQRDEDFIIKIRPYTDSDGSWSGDIDMAIMTMPGNKLEDEDYFQVMHLCKMIASTVSIMEDNEDIRNLVHDYVENTLDTMYNVELEEDEQPKQKAKAVNIEGNVITMSFGTDTKGSA